QLMSLAGEVAGRGDLLIDLLLERLNAVLDRRRRNEPRPAGAAGRWASTACHRGTAVGNGRTGRRSRRFSQIMRPLADQAFLEGVFIKRLALAELRRVSALDDFGTLRLGQVDSSGDHDERQHS